MIKITSLLLILTGTFFCTFAQEAQIKKSRRFLDHDREPEAIAQIELAIREHPKVASLYYYLGYAQLANGQLDAANKSFDTGIEKNKKEAINYAGKGHVYMLQGRMSEARAELDKALKISKSKKVPVLKAVAEAYLSNKQYAPQAITLLQRAKTIENDAEIELLLGDAFILQGQGGPAVSAYENASLLDAKNGKPHYKIGLIYARVNPPLAKQSFEKAVLVDSGFTNAYDELADIYYEQKDAARAVMAAEKFRQLSTDPEKIQLRLAFIYIMNGEYAKANQIFKEATNGKNVKPLVYRYYIKSLLATQLKTDSLESARISEQFLATAKAEDIFSRDYVDLGELYIAMGNDSLGELQLMKAIQHDPKSIEAAQVQAETLYKKKKYREAAVAYKRLVSIKETPSPNEYLNLARSYSITEQYAEADTIYSKLMEQYPTNIQVAVELARVKANIDSTQEQGLAKPVYEKILELGAADPERNKTYIIEAYKYMGAYYAIQEGNVSKGKEYFERVLSLNPNDNQAREVLEAIRAGAIQNNRKPG